MHCHVLSVLAYPFVVVVIFLSFETLLVTHRTFGQSNFPERVGTIAPLLQQWGLERVVRVGVCP